jgi:CDP-glucose 4,6-dehydratase
LASSPELAGEAFNFSNEIQITTLQLVERILSVMGSNLKPDIRDEVTGEIYRQHLSAAKAREILGWAPLFDLSRGLASTVNWYQEFFRNEQSR